MLLNAIDKLQIQLYQINVRQRGGQYQTNCKYHCDQSGKHMLHDPKNCRHTNLMAIGLRFGRQALSVIL